MITDKVRPHHLERKALLYVRQCSAHHVLYNRESSTLQYAMRDSLTALGWSEIEVIDDDLGRSAAGGVQRAGFERMVAEVCLGKIGACSPSRPDRVWNPIPDDVRRQIIDLALVVPELSPRELAVRFTDERKYFVSEASVYRPLKAHDLITSPAYVVIKAANEFKDKTTAINQFWQTDFTYLKIIGWGWYYLSTILDDFSRYIVAWRLGPTMCASDVTATLDQALAASGLDHVHIKQQPRLLSDNGSNYIANDLATWLKGKDMQHMRGASYHPQTQGKIERWHQTLKTASCSTTIIYPSISSGRSPPSSNITIMSAITRASTI